MATNEELETRLDGLEGLLVAEGEAPSGPEYSFPVPGQPIDQDQFQLLSLTDGNGIIDRGDYPYWLEGWGSDSETNQKNSMILKVGGKGKAEAIVGGYYHVLTEDKEVPLDAVTSTTTYYICITFDPRFIDDSGKEGNRAVSIQVYTTPPPTTFGRIHVVLYTVTRKANQLLTDAAVKRFRPRTVAPIAVLRREHLPDPANVLFGSVAILYGENDIVIARGASTSEGGPTRWDSLLDPEWTNREDTPLYGWPGHGHRRGYRRKGNTVELRGRVKRLDPSTTEFIPGGTSNDAGYNILTLPSELAPQREQRFITASNSYSGNRLVVVTVTSTGEVFAMPILGNATWMSLDNISFSLKD